MKVNVDFRLNKTEIDTLKNALLTLDDIIKDSKDNDSGYIGTKVKTTKHTYKVLQSLIRKFSI